MSNPTSQQDTEFSIPEEHLDSALNAIKELVASGEAESPGYLHNEEGYNDWDSVENALRDWGWNPYFDNDGNMSSIELKLSKDYNYKEDEPLWAALAKFVTEGSYIGLIDESGHFRVVFGDTEMEVVYPDFGDPFEEDEQAVEDNLSVGGSGTTEIATDTLATILEAARREYDSMEECHAPGMDTEPLLDAINTADEAIKSDEDRSPLEDLISVDGQTLSIASPTQSEHNIEWIDIDIEPLCENVNGDSILLDYYHGRPVVYFWEPGSEDAKHTIAPAVPEDEATRLIHCNHSIMEQNEQRVTGSAD